MRLFLSGRYLKWFVIVELLGLMILGVITGFLRFIAEMTAMLGYGLIKRSGKTHRASQQQFSQLNQLDPRALPRHIAMVGGFLLILPGLLTDAAGVLIALIGLSASVKQVPTGVINRAMEAPSSRASLNPTSDSKVGTEPNGNQYRLVQSPSTDFNNIVVLDLAGTAGQRNPR